MSALRVATFNLRNSRSNDGPDRWEARRDCTARLLQRLAPDLLGVQEAYQEQLDYLLETLPRYRPLGAGREDGKREGEYSAILYDVSLLRPLDGGTFWFSNTPEVPGSMSWGNRICRICTWAQFEDLQTGKRLRHYNLHIDHESSPSRVRSVGYLCERIRQESDSTRTIVTGDFNAGEDDPAIEAMREAGFRDSYRVAHPDATDVGTFNGFRDTYDPDKIDYIWVSPGIGVYEAAIVREKIEGRRPSDHAAVTATLRL